jgi:ElaB/YqjD/DUF883 family membrane-anchored ribosome-binding protein
MPPEATLGRALLRTLQDLDALIPKVSDTQLAELREKRAALLQSIGDLVETNLDKASVEYAQATAALDDASNRIREASANIAKVAQAIAMLGKALELAAKLAAA